MGAVIVYADSMTTYIPALVILLTIAATSIVRLGYWAGRHHAQRKHT